MLKIYFGDLEESIYNTDVYFDNTYEDDWLITPLAKEIIKDIDKSEVKSAHCIESPFLGQITPLSLSGGTKTLLLMMNDRNQIFNASTCGDNCAKWILELAKSEDLTINLRHLMDFGTQEFTIEIVNTHQIVQSRKDLFEIAGDLLRKQRGQ